MVDNLSSTSAPRRDIPGQEDQLTRFSRAVKEGERIERESAFQHDSHVRRYIAQSWDRA